MIIKGKKILYDKKDEAEIKKYNWYLKDGCYVMAAVIGVKPKKNIFMHHLVLPRKKGFETDHINGNPLDNRSKNLRYATSSQQKMNTKIRSDNTSGHKGVYFNNTKQRWLAEIWVDGKKITKHFLQIKDAIKARAEMEKEYFGEYARKKI